MAKIQKLSDLSQSLHAGESHNDGRGVRNAEGALLNAEDQGEEEGDGAPVHLLRDPHRQRGTLGRATDRAATRKGGIAKCSKRFQNGVLMRELLIRCAEKCGNQVVMNKKQAVMNNAAPKKRSKSVHERLIKSKRKN